MKKAILFALIMFVSVACVFSSISIDRHSVQLHTTVGMKTPAFLFEFTSGMATGIAVAADVDSGVDTYGTEDTAISVADISRKNLDLLFTVKLANKAKCIESYSLSFRAGSFAVTRNGVPGILAPDRTPVVAASSDIDSRLGVTATDVVEDGLKLRFNGTNCTEGSLATYHVRYTADGSIDDNEENEFYYADISLIITSDN